MRRTVLALACLFALPAAADRRYYEHIVQSQETLTSVAKLYLPRPSDWPLLQKHNALPPDNRIPIGTKIRVPVDAMLREPAPAKILSVQGTARARGNPATAGMIVREGDRLDTGDNGFVTIQLADGSTLTVQSKTAVKLETARHLANTRGVMHTALLLEKGRIETTVARQKGPAARYEIRTPTSNMAVRGTVFRAGADETGQRGQSEVVEGAVDLAGTARDASPVGLNAGFGSIVLAGQAPLPPIQLLPAPALAGLATEHATVSPVFAVGAVAGARAYRGQVARDAAFTEPVTDATSTTSSLAFDGLPDGVLYLRVRAIDSQGLEGTDATHRFTVRARPFAPALAGPADQGEVTTGLVAFAWQGADAAATHRLQVAADASFARIVAELKGLGGTRTALAVPLASGTWHWRMATESQGTTGPWSAAQRFTVRADRPVLKPVAGTGTPTLALSAAGRVQVSRREDFRDTVIDRDAGGATAVLDGLPPNTYFVRLRVGNGPWSRIGRLERYPGGGWHLETDAVAEILPPQPLPTR